MVGKIALSSLFVGERVWSVGGGIAVQVAGHEKRAGRQGAEFKTIEKAGLCWGDDSG